jgi:hypothetical protein
MPPQAKRKQPQLTPPSLSVYQRPSLPNAHAPPNQKSQFKIQKLNMLSARFPRRHDNCRKLIGLVQKLRQPLLRHDPAFHQKFEPQPGLVRLLLRNSKFAEKFCLRARSTCCPIICSNGRPAPQQLIPQSPAHEILRQGAGNLNHPQGKSLSALLHLVLSHSVLVTNSQTPMRPQIKNRNSKFKNSFMLSPRFPRRHDDSPKLVGSSKPSVRSFISFPVRP